MTIPETSIVMSAYKRAPQLRRTLESIEAQTYKDYEVIIVEDGFDDGETMRVCYEYLGRGMNLRYMQRANRPTVLFSGPAVPLNIGIKTAVGGIVVTQSAECMYKTTLVLERLITPIKQLGNVAVFPALAELDKDDNFVRWYSHSQGGLGKRPYMPACGATLRNTLVELGGFDEDYKLYGFDDDDMAARLSVVKVRFLFMDDVIVFHQWHDRTGDGFGLKQNKELFLKKVEQYKAGTLSPVANQGREWGSLIS